MIPDLPGLDALARIVLPAVGWAFGLGMVSLALWMVARRPLPKVPVVARLGGLVWNRNQVCRGWLITGDTGSGKTSSGINRLAHEVFQNVPDWGGLCIDEKGVYWETLAEMARHYGRTASVIHLRVRTEGEDSAWRPPHRFNLVGDRSIPFSTYAKFVVDTATSLGQGGDKGFFKTQTQTHIAHALELLHELGRPVTLVGAYELLTDATLLAKALEDLGELLQTPAWEALSRHFVSRLLEQPSEQLGGVRETIANHLQHFLAPPIAEVFSPREGSTFGFDALDRGGILLATGVASK